MAEPAEPDDTERDRAAEAWLTARHTSRWYIGDATEADWADAYAAVDAAARVL